MAATQPVPPQQQQLCRFTLMELIVALAILSLITGIVIGQFRRMPTRISLENSVNAVNGMMNNASNRALISGKEIKVTYDDTERAFTLSSLSENRSVSNKIKIPEEIELEIDVDFIDLVEFVFYPDGTASAPLIFFKLNDYVIYLEVSPLTGIGKTGYKE
jgi:prepilin-type N-terminal cleavage/methylation domain-containing protein